MSLQKSNSAKPKRFWEFQGTTPGQGLELFLGTLGDRATGSASVFLPCHAIHHYFSNCPPHSDGHGRPKLWLLPIQSYATVGTCFFAKSLAIIT